MADDTVPVTVVRDRRVPKTNETVQMWLNVASTIAAVVPQFLPSLLAVLPWHYYGILSAAVFAINAGIDFYRRSQYGKLIYVEEEQT